MTILELKNISKNFVYRSSMFGKMRQVQALKDVSFKVQQGEILSIVGESGSGKSTLIKIIQGVLNADSGNVLINGQDSKNLNRIQKAKIVQTIFQDPYASLNPKLSVRTILQEAMTDASQQKLEHLLNQVGLDKTALPLYPHQFSGGQRQRIGIARCLAAQPQIILADEPVSALDVSIQAQILNLMMSLNEKGITFLLITHDLSIVKHLSDRVIILDQGQIVEENLTHHIFNSPQNPSTKKLFNAIFKL